MNLNAQTPQTQFNGAVVADTRKLVISDVWAITPRYVNDFRVSYSRLVANFAIPSNFASMMFLANVTSSARIALAKVINCFAMSAALANAALV